MGSHPPKLISVVHYHQMPGTQPTPYRVRSGAEVVEVVTSGRGWVETDSGWLEVLPGSMLWHVAGDLTIGRSSPDEPYSCLAVRMDGAAEKRHVPQFSYWHDLGEVVSLTEEAIRMFLDDDFDNSVLFAHLHAKLRYQALLYHHRRENANLAEPLRLARSLIETRYAEALTVELLAKTVGWSVAHLHDRFKAAYGSSPRQMILKRRLRSAREQLVGTGYSVKEIAARTGFTHSSAFCSSFRKAFGVTPKTYRERNYFG